MKEKGYISLLLFLLLVPLAAIFLWSSNKLSTPVWNFQSQNDFCRPSVDNNRNPLPEAPLLKAPDYEYFRNEPTATPPPYPPITPGQTYPFPIPCLKSDIENYKLIKSNVPFIKFDYDENYIRGSSHGTPDCIPPYPDNPIFCAYGGWEDERDDYHMHFCQYKHGVYVAEAGKDIYPIPATTTGTKYFAVLYPISFTEVPGQSSDYDCEGCTEGKHIFYAAHKLIFLLHVDADGKAIVEKGTTIENGENKDRDIVFADIYQQVKKVNDHYEVEDQYKLPENVIKCIDNKTTLGQVIVPQNPNPDKVSQDKKELQLEHVIPNYMKAETSWYYPACKPAIYLYPQEKTFVNVKVNTKGSLTYTNPLYSNLFGWNVTAYPGGKLIVNNNSFDYLYYESKIKDSDIKKPNEGFVVSYEELPKLYDELLPKLGLVDNEAKEFKDYWEKVLPKEKYYFVGIMKQEEIDGIEPLTIVPKPDTILRVRLFFEALENQIQVREPNIVTPKRSGFTLVEWGGMVKIDKDHPFTCSM